jgi:1,4-dihydroxy-2-naphthoate octaprenyltransferase
MRLPFSYFLLPIFIFAVSQSSEIHLTNSIVIFIVLHLFIYPGSNMYNSYIDRDSGSIGALKNPPPVSDDLFYASIFLDSIGLLLMLFTDIRLLILMLVYVAVSKAYSWNKIRLKKYAVIGWLTVILFQGGYTFMLVSMAC